jgi:hypothetical protein
MSARATSSSLVDVTCQRPACHCFAALKLCAVAATLGSLYVGNKTLFEGRGKSEAMLPVPKARCAGVPDRSDNRCFAAEKNLPMQWADTHNKHLL